MPEIRKTKQKEIILKYLIEHENEHLSIEKIQLDLKDNVGTATIYRMMNKLCQEGYVMKTPLNKQGFCYKYNKNKCNCNKQFHLICEECGNIEHLKTDIILNLGRKVLKKEGFDIDIEKLSFYGLCKKCRR